MDFYEYSATLQVDENPHQQEQPYIVHEIVGGHLFYGIVEALTVDTVNVSHASGDIAVRCMNQQMIMIRHQAI